MLELKMSVHGVVLACCWFAAVIKHHRLAEMREMHCLTVPEADVCDQVLSKWLVSGETSLPDF